MAVPGYKLAARAGRAGAALCLLLFAAVFLLNAWVGDDAYITFRAIDNFLHGHGLRWNVAERVQVYTHPLWMLLMTAAAAVTREFYFTALGVSLLAGLAALFALWTDRTMALRQKMLLILALASSKAYIEYSSSGLENPLSHFLLALFYVDYFRGDPEAEAWPARRIARLYLVASLAYLARPDAILLYLPALLHATVKGFAACRFRLWKPVLAGTSPAWLWHVFSAAYYGFVFPNTYYAKLAGAGIPGRMLLAQGLAYLWHSLRFDPLTFIVIVLGGLTLLVLARRSLRAAAAAVALLLYLFYVVRIGGDFMSGRFLTLPFLLSALALARRLCSRRLGWVALALLAVYNLAAPRAPIKMSRRYEPWDSDAERGIADERGYYQKGAALLFYRRGRPFPENAYTALARAARQSGRRAHVSDTIGFSGFVAGPEIHIIDKLGLADPLLARLPISRRSLACFQIGHFARRIPAGYVESCESGGNLVADPGLADYYEGLRTITRGPLWTAERWRCIARYNVGADRTYPGAYQTD